MITITKCMCTILNQAIAHFEVRFALRCILRSKERATTHSCTDRPLGNEADRADQQKKSHGLLVGV